MCKMMKEQEYTAGMMKLLGSNLDGRQFQINMGHVLSIPGIPKTGVSQGEVLSPLMYTIYTMDIPKTKRTTISLYADDTAISVTTIQPEPISTRRSRRNRRMVHKVENQDITP